MFSFWDLRGFPTIRFYGILDVFKFFLCLNSFGLKIRNQIINPSGAIL